MLSEQFSPQASLNSQESILYSALHCIVLCWVLLEQCSRQASLNSQESMLYSALYCIVLCWVVLCCRIVLYCIAYSARQSLSPTVSKNKKIRAKVDSRIYGRWRLRWWAPTLRVLTPHPPSLVLMLDRARFHSISLESRPPTTTK